MCFAGVPTWWPRGSDGPLIFLTLLTHPYGLSLKKSLRCLYSELPMHYKFIRYVIACKASLTRIEAIVNQVGAGIEPWVSLPKFGTLFSPSISHSTFKMGVFFKLRLCYAIIVYLWRGFFLTLAELSIVECLRMMANQIRVPTANSSLRINSIIGQCCHLCRFV